VRRRARRSARKAPSLVRTRFVAISWFLLNVRDEFRADNHFDEGHTRGRRMNRLAVRLAADANAR
jgi:hypothetical protein